MNEENYQETLNETPLIQLAQECAYCFQPLLADDETETYRGISNFYENWICHKSCVEIATQKSG
jgi:hypothetical protein